MSFGPIHHAIDIIQMVIELCQNGRNGDCFGQTFNVQWHIFINMVKEPRHKLITHGSSVLNDAISSPLVRCSLLLGCTPPPPPPPPPGGSRSIMSWCHRRSLPTLQRFVGVRSDAHSTNHFLISRTGTNCILCSITDSVFFGAWRVPRAHERTRAAPMSMLKSEAVCSFVRAVVFENNRYHWPCRSLCCFCIKRLLLHNEIHFTVCSSVRGTLHCCLHLDAFWRTTIQLHSFRGVERSGCSCCWIH